MRRKCVHNEYQHAQAHTSLQNATKGSDRMYMILVCTEEYFSMLDDADKSSEKRKIKNKLTKNGSLHQINCIIWFIKTLLSII